MKKCLFSYLVACSLAGALDFEEGFSGNLSMGVGIRDIKSNLSTLANKDFLSDYNAKNSDSAFVPFLGIEFYYSGLVDNDRIFVKNYNGRDISGVALGYERAYWEDFITSFALVSSLREKAYADPYKKGYREETDVSKYGFKISQFYESDLGKVSASYLFSRNRYDKDNIRYSSLKREGVYHEFEVSYQYSLVNLGLNYDYNNAEGKAQSYSRYSVDIGLNLVLAQNYILNPNFNFSKYEAQENDPIFRQKQNGHIMKMNLKVIKNQFLGYSGLYGFAHYGIEKRNSDIGFYDESYQIALTGVGYKF
ncbi:DUF2860 domain-containing protein [Campylobacter sp. VicNov18]|uniref:DUF2860 family protein n=1 Tax=Campylobacter bilis TaxID=2691918 RepID=UPI00130D8FEF|nr:DUF2860 family protein [Campylobacter bilis]MPV64114.1 DUF2860 domain-containing protein [Campylobacter hepaticus]MBM0637617.1 DUF2860 domain-containing protein [Campylobacter bilis]MCC8278343.1 DUF2860 domain-containing protein [Campylobacter bilis]MCC8299846.1 DUF2860 domain-containing protein [Campylobacter bilis]MCC8301252.1 DUF2860 domain-containing protein [Campylobacter bilis]